MDLFACEGDPLELRMMRESRNIGDPAGVLPVVDSTAESICLEQREDGLSVSTQLNLKALINFYLPLRGL